MHQAALQGLKLVGTDCNTGKNPRSGTGLHTITIVIDAREQPEDPDPRMRKYHHAVTTALDAVVEADDLGLHRQGTTTARDTEEEADGPNLQYMHTTTKTTKLQWEHYALPTGFTEHQYPKDSNYPMISRSMMDHKSPSRGYQTTFKP
jgi:hypothetical protein